MTGSPLESGSGSYDQASMLLHLDPELTAVTGAATATGLEAVLGDAGAPGLAHELAHFAQATTTGWGARSLALYLDLYSRCLSLLVAAAEARPGPLTVPLLQNASLYDHSPEFRQRVEQLQRSWRYARLLAGGPLDQFGTVSAAPGEADSNAALHRVQPVAAEAGGLPVWVLGDLAGARRPQVLGGTHLMEACGDIVERRYRLLSAGERPTGPGASLAGADQLPGANRYLAIETAIAWALDDEATRRLSAESMFVLIDLALMLEPVVLSDVTSPGERPAYFRGFPLHPGRCSIVDVLWRVVAAWAEHGDDLPELAGGTLEQEGVNQLQETLLGVLGCSTGLIGLTERVEASFASTFGHLGSGLWGLTHRQLGLMQATTQRMLRWRRDTLDGGAALVELQRPATELRELAASALPAVAIGQRLFSSPAPGGPAGEQAALFSVTFHTVRQLALGGGGCPLDRGTPRMCSVPRQALCQQPAPAAPSASVPCARSAVLAKLAGDLSIEGFVGVPPSEGDAERTSGN